MRSRQQASPGTPEAKAKPTGVRGGRREARSTESRVGDLIVPAAPGLSQNAGSGRPGVEAPSHKRAAVPRIVVILNLVREISWEVPSPRDPRVKPRNRG